MNEANKYLILLIFISILNSLAQVLMRWGGKLSNALPEMSKWQWLWHSRWWLMGVLAGWICGLGWAWVLRKIPLSFAWPFTAGLIYVMVLIWSHVLLHERMKPIQLGGATLIFIGLTMLFIQK